MRQIEPLNIINLTKKPRKQSSERKSIDCAIRNVDNKSMLSDEKIELTRKEPIPQERMKPSKKVSLRKVKAITTHHQPGEALSEEDNFITYDKFQ